MPSDELDPKLEAATQEFISVSKIISQAIVLEARGSARYKTSIAISRDWPERLPKHPLSEQITAHIAADHKLRGVRSTVFPNEAAALSWYLQDSLSARNVTVGNFGPHGAALLDGRTQRAVVKKILDTLLPECELELYARAEIPGIDLKRAAGFIRYGHGHKVPIAKIVFWFQQEWPWHAIVEEVREGGIPPGYPMEPEGPELGGHGPQIAEVLRHSIDSDLGLDLARIANWMETCRWPLEVTPGEIIAAISEHGEKPSSRFAVPVVELFWLFGRSREMGAWRRSLHDSLQFDLQNLADAAIMRPPEFESESEIVSPLAPAASPLEPAATPGPAADPPAKIPEPRIPAEEIVEQAVAQEQQSGADAAAEQLSTRLKRGKLCEEMAGEIKTIRGEAITNGKAMFEIRQAYPEFLVWNAAERLLPEDRAVFEMPTRWGAANGYANRFLSKVFPPKSPATVNDWRKEFRAHKKQNPT